MQHSTMRGLYKALGFFVGCVLISLADLLSAWAQQEIPPDLITDSIRIVSPADGAVVRPGETITVSVEVAQGSSFPHVGVIAENIGLSQAKTSPPFDFSFVIPNNLVGPKKLTALGIIRPGEGLFSRSVTINIEPASALSALKVSFTRINFKYPGQQSRLHVDGVFSDGRVLDITRSSQTTFSSGDNGVATIDPTGLVTATGPGSTNILVGYGSQSAAVPVSVPKTVPGDLNANGKVTRDDLNILLGYLGVTVFDDWTNIPASKSKPATGPFDARDLNGDGVVNSDDVSIMVGLIGALADLSINLSASPISVTVGSQVAYTLTVANNGPNPAPYVWVRGLLPKSQFVSSSIKECGVMYDRASCNFASLESGQSIIATIVTIPDTVGLFTGVLNIGSGVPDPVVANDIARVDVNVNAAPPQTVPARMSGDGHIDGQGKRYHFEFNVRERASGEKRGRIEVRVQEHKPGRDRDTDDEKRGHADRFVSTNIASVVFSDNPSITPGRQPQPPIDSVELSGTGHWNGKDGYTFDARATDAGEPGKERDSFAITIKDKAGKIVATIAGALSGGNIQSLKARR